MTTEIIIEYIFLAMVALVLIALIRHLHYITERDRLRRIKASQRQHATLKRTYEKRR